MGAGASFEPVARVPEGATRLICHSCRNIYYNSDLISDSAVINCPFCNSAFVEDITNTEQQHRYLAQHTLSEEQARRFANATIMLRLLDNQLRNELDSLQRIYATTQLQPAELKSKKMSVTMHDKLRHTHVDVDMICTLPSCPICSEDYVENAEEKVVQLPCCHFYHPNCVLPWLDLKKTCPICRYEMTDDLPTMDELKRFTESEIIERLTKEIDNNTTDYSTFDKSQLLTEFMNHITNRREARLSTASEKKTSVGFNLGTIGESSRLNSGPSSPATMTRHFVISDSVERDYQAFFDQLALRQRWDYDDNGGVGPLSARRETSSSMRIAIGGPSLLIAPSISPSHAASQNSNESSQLDSSSQSTGVIGSTYVIRQSSSSTPVITRIDHP